MIDIDIDKRLEALEKRVERFERKGKPYKENRRSPYDLSSGGKSVVEKLRDKR